jgi:hypothetical protein
VKDDSHVGFDQQFPGEKESVRRCVVMMQRPALLSPKFGSNSSHIFTQSPQNIIVVCGIDGLTSQGEFFVNNLLDVKENDKHAPDFELHFGSGEFGLPVYGSYFLPRTLV